MTVLGRVTLAVLLMSVVLGMGDNATAAPTYVFKVASLAPDGSVWAKRFHDFTDEVREKSNGEIVFKVYPGGVMGDDRAMYRKMRIGQLHGGGFTMTGIGEVVNDFRVLGVPFLFSSYDEVDRAWQGVWTMFKKAFADKGLVLLAVTEVGFIYTMSKTPIASIEDLRKSKCWAPEGDPISYTYLETIGVTPTPLSIPDVLTSLQTGLIDTVFNSFYGSIVLQWFTSTRYIADVPFAYGYGAFVLESRQFSRLPPEYMTLMESAARKHFANLMQDTRKSNAEALTVLKQNGLELVQPEPGAMEELKKHREETVRRLVGSAFSKEIYEAVVNSLNGRPASTAGKTHPQVRPPAK